MATMFPIDGYVEGFTVAPSEKEIIEGSGPGALKIPLHPKIYKPLEFLGKYLGWIVPHYEKPSEKPKIEPPPKPEGAGDGGAAAGAYSREGVYVDPRISRFARAYANMARDFDENGIELYALPEEEMIERFNDPDGYQIGRRAYVNGDLPDVLEVGSHEGVTALLEELTGIDHNGLHNVVRPLEPVMAVEYRMGMPNVLQRNARRAMEELRRAA